VRPSFCQRAFAAIHPRWLGCLCGATLIAVLGAWPGAAVSDPFAPAPGSPFYAGSQPVGLATGDFNGDGNLDVAAANQDAATVTPLLGYGSGQLSALSGTPVGNGPTALAAGDYNGDGFGDVAVADGNDGDVRILLSSGDGDLTPAGLPIPVGANPVAVIAGDFTGAGTPDLAVANFGSGTVSVLIGDGRGVFHQGPESPISVNTPVALASADFNRDGVPDLAIADEADNSVQVVLGSGTGAFQPAPAGPITVGTSPSAIYAADFNQDGVPDLAVLNRSDGTISVLLGNGDGSFDQAPQSPIALGGGIGTITVGDFNGDAVPDLVAVDSQANTVSFQFGNGDGTFTPAAEGPQQVGSTPDALAVGDFNSDGGSDLGVANFGDATVTVLLGNSSGSNSFCDSCLPPILGVSVDLVPVRGRVFVKLPHRAHHRGRFIRLRAGRQLPVGTVVNASAGTVRLSAAGVRATPAIQRANLRGSEFQILQSRFAKGLTNLKLMPITSRKVCGKPGRAVIRNSLSRRVLALLHASGHGKFRTTGRYSAATVRGTQWDTADRCDGTLTRVLRGVVTVRDFRLRRTIAVHAGHSYLAKP
jgi:FG-GAP-like repeat